jgi:hypothetical protein
VQRLAGRPSVQAVRQHEVELAAGADAELGEDLAQVVLDLTPGLAAAVEIRWLLPAS